MRVGAHIRTKAGSVLAHARTHARTRAHLCQRRREVLVRDAACAVGVKELECHEEVLLVLQLGQIERGGQELLGGHGHHGNRGESRQGGGM